MRLLLALQTSAKSLCDIFLAAVANDASILPKDLTAATTVAPQTAFAMRFLKVRAPLLCGTSHAIRLFVLYSVALFSQVLKRRVLCASSRCGPLLCGTSHAITDSIRLSVLHSVIMMHHSLEFSSAECHALPQAARPCCVVPAIPSGCQYCTVLQ